MLSLPYISKQPSYICYNWTDKTVCIDLILCLCDLLNCCSLHVVWLNVDTEKHTHIDHKMMRTSHINPQTLSNASNLLASGKLVSGVTNNHNFCASTIFASRIWNSCFISWWISDLSNHNLLINNITLLLYIVLFCHIRRSSVTKNFTNLYTAQSI